MILGQNQDVSDFLEGIMMGFQTNTIELIIVFSSITALLTLFILFFVIQNKKNYQKRRAYAQRRFEELTRDIELTEVEKKVLEQMAETLPGGILRKHIVVSDSNAYDRAAQNLVENGYISEEMAASLRIKIGFPVATDTEPIHTTAEIPKGTHFYCIDEYENRFHAVLYDYAPHAMYIKVHEKQNELPRGNQLRIYFRQKNGVFTFSTTVTEINEDILICTHADKIEQEQKRQYYRKEVDEEITIKRSTEDQRVTARMFDLGGGGAKIDNPEGHFNQGDDVELFLDLDNTGTLTIPAQVIKTSGDGKYLHVQFHNIREPVRDKVFNYLFTS